MNAEQTHIIEMSLNILNDIAQSLKTIAENAAARKTNKDWPTEKKPGGMTTEEAIRVLSMIECHGSLSQKAKEKAIEALRKEEEG